MEEILIKTQLKYKTIKDIWDNGESKMSYVRCYYLIS